MGVAGMQDPVQHRIAQVHVGGGHVDFGPQHLDAVSKFTSPHPAELIQVFLHATTAEGRVLTCFGQGAAILFHLFRGQVINVCFALLNQVLGPLVELLKIL